MAVCGLEGRILTANTALARLLGYAHDEVVGVNPWELGADLEAAEGSAEKLVHPAGMSEVVSSRGGWFVVERQWPRRDGTVFWGRLSATFIGENYDQPGLLIALLEDAGERHLLEERMRQSEKMEAMGRLAGGVAHDFNNLLTGILLYSDLLQGELETKGEAHRYVNEVRLACEQGAALTQQLLAVARKSDGVVRVAGVNEVVAGTQSLLRRLIGEQIELLVELDPAASVVKADAGKVRQILLNLVLNGRDALRWEKRLGGRIRINTRSAELGGNLGEGARRRSGCLLTVEDNGCGMSTETRAHLFEPFFTTKQAGEGTGLGLGTVQRIVSEMGGKIEIASVAGAGTRIEVFLPVEHAGTACLTEPSLTAASDATFRDGLKGRGSGNTQVPGSGP